MPFQKKSTPLKCYHCQRQGHLVKYYPIPRKRKECQAILIKLLEPETSVSLVLPIETFTMTETTTWKAQIERFEQQAFSEWNALIYKQQSLSNWDIPIYEPE